MYEFFKGFLTAALKALLQRPNGQSEIRDTEAAVGLPSPSRRPLRGRGRMEGPPLETPKTRGAASSCEWIGS